MLLVGSDNGTEAEYGGSNNNTDEPAGASPTMPLATRFAATESRAVAEVNAMAKVRLTGNPTMDASSFDEFRGCVQYRRGDYQVVSVRF